jgi:uncharacterized 2Fe-2S/4Fe-4S cluster protein (DUF4445 family)
VSKATCIVILQPVGRRVEVPAGTSLLDAARLAGVELVALCGGEGTCGACRLRPVEGRLSPLTRAEESELTPGDLSTGYRLACQAQVLGDVRVDIPPESLTAPQRLQLEGLEIPLELDPAVIPLEVEVPPPSLADLRADLTRLRDTLAGIGRAELHFSLETAASLPARLRASGWRLRLALRGDQVVAILPPGRGLFGLAVDIGTTKLAAYLVDLETGRTAAKIGAMNPQIAYGEDVISRITFANGHSDGAQTLQARLVEELNRMVGDLCAEAGVGREQVVEAVAVGNTAMHHLFTGLPVRQLGESPYVAAVAEAVEFPARQVGLDLAAGAIVYMPPNIAGYVGADHVAMLLGAGLGGVSQTTLALDIGTNTEISLFHQGRHLACSCASGPAFEGAHIKDGMRAAPGAIERVRLSGDVVQVHTIGGQPAVGICGSGILDTVAGLLKAGMLDGRGVLRGMHPRLQIKAGQAEFILVSAAESGTHRDIKVGRKDINEIQLAKAAIRTGIEILLADAGISASDIQSFIVAGAFGTYLDLESAVRIGMFPDLPRERFRQVGNAAGGGARLLLASTPQRAAADALARRVEYVELANDAGFMDVYVKALAFP